MPAFKPLEYVDGESGTAWSNAQAKASEENGAAWATLQRELAEAASIPASQKGAALGVAPLDGSGLLPLVNLPSSIVTTASGQVVTLWTPKTSFNIGTQIAHEHLLYKVEKSIPNTINTWSGIETGGYVAPLGTGGGGSGGGLTEAEVLALIGGSLATYTPTKEPIETLTASSAELVLPSLLAFPLIVITLNFATPKLVLPAPQAGVGGTAVLIQGGAGSSIPKLTAASGAVHWEKGTLPSFSTAPGAKDIVSYLSYDGINYEAFLGGLDLK